MNSQLEMKTSTDEEVKFRLFFHRLRKKKHSNLSNSPRVLPCSPFVSPCSSHRATQDAPKRIDAQALSRVAL